LKGFRTFRFVVFNRTSKFKRVKEFKRQANTEEQFKNFVITLSALKFEPWSPTAFIMAPLRGQFKNFVKFQFLRFLTGRLPAVTAASQGDLQRELIPLVPTAVSSFQA
jgi:hypothetical protein